MCPVICDRCLKGAGRIHFWHYDFAIVVARLQLCIFLILVTNRCSRTRLWMSEKSRDVEAGALDIEDSDRQCEHGKRHEG